jgi:hypothetical protein
MSGDFCDFLDMEEIDLEILNERIEDFLCL